MSEASLESSARAAADRIFSRMEETWNAADVQAYSKVYAEDASYVNRYGVLHLGRQEIARIHAAALASRFHNTKLRMAMQYFSLLAPTIAVAHVTAATTAASKRSQAIRTTVTTVLSSKSGEWQIAALHVSDIQPES